MDRHTLRPGAIALAIGALLAVFPTGAPRRAAAQPATPGRPLLITVDDLPMSSRHHPDPADRARVTEGMLAVLAAHRIPAVGLVTWSNVAGPRDRELLERWLAAGHELGNHSYGHLDFTRTELAAYLADVESARRELAGLLATRGKALRFFRFPFLREGETAAKVAAARAWLAETGQRNLPVTIDDQDWSFEEPWLAAVRRGDEAAKTEVALGYHEALHVAVRHHEAAGDRLFGRTVPQILLLHAGAVSAAQWDRLFTWLTARGYRFATADEVLADPAFAVEPQTPHPFGFGLWDRLADDRRRAQARDEVTKLLAEQSEAWSRGDLDAFCSVYAEDALFLSPTGTTRGRAEVLARYRKRYPDRAAMGRLTLDVHEIRLAAGPEFTLLGDAAPGRVQGASVAATWRLTFPDQPEKPPAEGLTLVVFAKTPAGWRIVQDASM